jgi:hypothetical protein
LIANDSPDIFGIKWSELGNPATLGLIDHYVYTPN